MKKLILLLMPLIFIGWTWGETEWYETSCQICGKTIFYEREVGFDNDMAVSTITSSPPGETGIMLDGVSGLVCDGCYRKYSDAYRDWCMEWLEKAFDENSESRKLFNAQRKIDTINKNKERIKELQNEIEALKK